MASAWADTQGTANRLWSACRRGPAVWELAWIIAILSVFMLAVTLWDRRRPWGANHGTRPRRSGRHRASRRESGDGGDSGGGEGGYSDGGWGGVGGDGDGG